MNWGLFWGVFLGVVIIANTLVVLLPVVPPITFVFFILVGCTQIYNAIRLET
jgi:hypothetical protein